ncbi:TetR/AcrR family transcriptional regulator [Arthrobacter alpinus]|uniref:TetR/AcrR family transcriptional regulator n=1 Tax=Arthrobacter alpinus TaxID=656366 RepID=UPI0009EB76FD|nr:TetR/AcrR family transcriptional regulator [Arthrobacter alpinus]
MSSALPNQQNVHVFDPAKAASEARATLRKRQLLSAAARLMARDGADSVSMHALATEASVSVGLIYRYFGNKEDLLLAVIVEVLDAFDHQVPAAIEAAGTDPVERIAAAFAAYCNVINEHRDAAVLSYRESKSLGAEGRNKIKELEISTVLPLQQAVLEAIDAGRLVRVDAELFAYNLLLLAHAWALKRWYFERSFDFDTYVRKQTAVALAAVVQAEHRASYSHLLDLS